MNASVRLTGGHLHRHALPLVMLYWSLRRPGEPRVRPGCGPTPAFEPILDEEREEVGNNWAVLSSWAPRPIFFAPEVPLEPLHSRFPFARPRAASGVVQLLALHELAHHLLAHSGLSMALDHEGSRQALAAKFAGLEAEADALTRVFWGEGLTASTVSPRVARKAA